MNLKKKNLELHMLPDIPLNLKKTIRKIWWDRVNLLRSGYILFIELVGSVGSLAITIAVFIMMLFSIFFSLDLYQYFALHDGYKCSDDAMNSIIDSVTALMKDKISWKYVVNVVLKGIVMAAGIVSIFSSVIFTLIKIKALLKRRKNIVGYREYMNELTQVDMIIRVLRHDYKMEKYNEFD